jgi:hypothetical protein
MPTHPDCSGNALQREPISELWVVGDSWAGLSLEHIEATVPPGVTVSNEFQNGAIGVDWLLETRREELEAALEGKGREVLVWLSIGVGDLLVQWVGHEVLKARLLELSSILRNVRTYHVSYQLWPSDGLAEGVAYDTPRQLDTRRWRWINLVPPIEPAVWAGDEIHLESADYLRRVQYVSSMYLERLYP